MEKNVFKVPISLEANSRDELTFKCMENNRVNNIMFDYYFFQKVGSKWIAWFRADMTKRLKRPDDKQEIIGGLIKE